MRRPAAGAASVDARYARTLLLVAGLAGCGGDRERSTPAPGPSSATEPAPPAIDAATPRPRPTEVAHLTLKALGMT